MKKPPRRRNRKHTYLVQIDRTIHCWLRDTVVTRAERKWLDHACKLALDHAILLHGEEAMENHSITMAVVGRAAEQIWVKTSGRPDWGALDVDAAVDRWFGQIDADLLDDVVWTLAAFVQWLGSEQHLANADAKRLLRELEPRMASALRSITPWNASHAVN